jgi:putative transposase
MYLSPTKENALEAYHRFLSEDEGKYPKAIDYLRKDGDVLFVFYDFLVEHWRKIRTTNPIESTFATVWHREVPPKNWTGVEGAFMPTFLKKEVWYNARYETSA